MLEYLGFCEEPPIILNGQISSFNMTHSSAKCISGYYPDLTVNYSCDSNRRWNPDPQDHGCTG